MLHFSEAAVVLEEKFDGSPVEVVRRANKSARDLLKILTEEFACFNDMSDLYPDVR